MGKHCAAIGCSNTNKKLKIKTQKKGVSFHAFPLKNPQILQKWIHRIRREDFIPTPYSFLCSDHFNEDDFDYQPFTGMRMIKPGAVPSKLVFTKGRLERKRMLHEFEEELLPDNRVLCPENFDDSGINCQPSIGQRLLDRVVVPSSFHRSKTPNSTRESVSVKQAPTASSLKLRCRPASNQSYTPCRNKACIREMRRLNQDLFNALLMLKWLQEKIQELQEVAKKTDLNLLNALVYSDEEGKGELDKVYRLVRYLMDEMEVDQELYEGMQIDEDDSGNVGMDDSAAIPSMDNTVTVPFESSTNELGINSPFEHQHPSPHPVERGPNRQRYDAQCKTGWQEKRNLCSRLINDRQESLAVQPPASGKDRRTLSESTNTLSSYSGNVRSAVIKLIEKKNLTHRNTKRKSLVTKDTAIVSKQRTHSKPVKDKQSHTDLMNDKKPVFLFGPLNVDSSGVCTSNSQANVIPMCLSDSNRTGTVPGTFHISSSKNATQKIENNSLGKTIKVEKSDIDNNSNSDVQTNNAPDFTDTATDCLRTSGSSMRINNKEQSDPIDRRVEDKTTKRLSPIKKPEKKKTVKKKMCELCGKLFHSPYSLMLHVRGFHKGEKPFECGICGRKFNIPFALKTHMESHSELRPFQCSLCSKAFKLKRTLDRHQTTHTDEQPFHCMLCDRGFKRKESLTLHQKQFHM